MSKKILPFLAILLIVGLIVVFQRFPLFQVRSQSLKLTRVGCVTQSELVSQINLVGQNIFLANVNDLSQNLKKKYLCIKDVSLNKNLPNSVVVIISGRVPIAELQVIPDSVDRSLGTDLEATPSTRSAFEVEAQAIDAASISAKFLVDDSGFLYSGDSPNFTQIYLLGSVKGGDSLENGFIQATLQIVNKLAELQLPIVRPVVMKDSYLAVFSNKPDTIFFSLSSDVNKELASLQLLLQKSKMNQDQIDMIDLRFKNPIVVYSKKR